VKALTDALGLFLASLRSHFCTFVGIPPVTKTRRTLKMRLVPLSSDQRNLFGTHFQSRLVRSSAICSPSWLIFWLSHTHPIQEPSPGHSRRPRLSGDLAEDLIGIAIQYSGACGNIVFKIPILGICESASTAAFMSKWAKFNCPGEYFAVGCAANQRALSAISGSKCLLSESQD